MVQTTLRAVRGKASLLVALALLSLTAAPGCSRRDDPMVTIERLDSQIESYGQEPSDATAARIDATFAKLEAEIAAMRADAEAETGETRTKTLARAEALEARGAALRKTYYAARVGAATDAAKAAVKQFGASVGKTLEAAGEKMKNALGDGDAQDDRAQAE